MNEEETINYVESLTPEELEHLYNISRFHLGAYLCANCEKRAGYPNIKLKVYQELGKTYSGVTFCSMNCFTSWLKKIKDMWVWIWKLAEIGLSNLIIKTGGIMIQIPVQSNCCNLQNDFRGKMMGSIWLSIGYISSSEITFITFNNSYLGYMFLFANREVIRTLCLRHVLQSNTKNQITFVTSIYSKYQKLFQGGGKNGN